MPLHPSDTPQLIKRKLLALLGSLPFGVSCAQAEDADATLKRRFRGIVGVVVVIDVARGAEKKKYMALVSDTGRRIAAPAEMGHGGRANLGFTGGVLPVPRIVRVTWRDGDAAYDEGVWTGGKVVGDHTVEVANRIPNEVLDYIRAARGRALRLKFRLKDDGVLFAWDVEESFTTQYGDGLRYKLPGGDFLDTNY